MNIMVDLWKKEFSKQLDRPAVLVKLAIKDAIRQQPFFGEVKEKKEDTIKVVPNGW